MNSFDKTHDEVVIDQSPSPSRRVRILVTSLVLATAALVAPAAGGSAPASAWSSQMVDGRAWLNGRGVDVLRGRQCVELATRLYARKNWGSLNNIYAIRRGNTPAKIKFHANGSGYVPVPGDVLVEGGGSYQHVAVVSHANKKRIVTMEQNAAPSGRHVYPKRGKKYVGAYGVRYVRGFIHSTANPNKNRPLDEVKKDKKKSEKKKSDSHKNRKKTSNTKKR